MTACLTHLRHSTLIATTVAAMVIAMTTPTASQTPQPGDILAATQSQFSTDPVRHRPYPGVRATKVLYRSHTALDEPVDVSGTILVPEKAWTGDGKRPLVSYATGTKGWTDRCAPSNTLPLGSDYDGPIVAALLDRGWGVAVTDYQGIGTNSPHAWQVGQAEARTVLDITRAAMRLPGSGLDTTHPVGIYGYSQGGGAAAATAELAPRYSPELNVVGVTAGGAPADWNIHLNKYDAGTVTAATGLLAGTGFTNAYPELRLRDFLNERGRQVVDLLSQRCITEIDSWAVMLSNTSAHMSDFFSTINPFLTKPWLIRFAENRNGEARPPMPVLLIQGTLEEAVPYEIGETLHRDWCGRGANVKWQTYPLGHAGAFIASVPASVDFLASRFNGTPATGNCAAISHDLGNLPVNPAPTFGGVR